MEEREALVMHKEQTSLGTVTIAEEVVRIIAGLAATNVQGVADMSGGIAGGIVERLGRRNLSKGVKVEVGEKEAAVDIYVIVEFGARIPELAASIQKAVKGAVEEMTGLNVVETNVNIQGVAFEEEPSANVDRVK
ncbi:MAG TPA: Asp23/Gls24 family envelope stress response protein [Desulfotomaculum sp.]|nr:MAG: alkaline-shock protein [Peptococcaceae bacterium BRH_c8a]KJS70744.1 MAG: alkaline-shock protein [Desulfotomaculum sp. BICA1-6]HBX24408.1 Asp23/Gls24 family envelope stress response protein [Desulfotomaculum sp.]